VLYEHAMSDSRAVALMASSQVKVLRAGIEINPVTDTAVEFKVAEGLEEALAAHPAHGLPIPLDVAKDLGVTIDADGQVVTSDTRH